jgi:molybdate transport system substrate-binding protein
VRAGAPKSNISTVGALKQALLDTKSIAYAREGASGIYFARLLERLGIADAMHPKTRFGTGSVAELVARGEAELAVQLITELIAVPGAALVGPLSAEVQNYVVLTASVGAAAKELGPARELISSSGLRLPSWYSRRRAWSLGPRSERVPYVVMGHGQRSLAREARKEVSRNTAVF